MGKRDKKAVKTPHVTGSPARESMSASPQGHPPKRQPVLLAVSIIMFALWFVFLLVTAVFG